MPRKLLKYKNYDIHSITTATPDGRKNANIAMWVMQTAMGGKMLCVALDKTDYTLELVRESRILNVNLLAEEQTRPAERPGGRQIQRPGLRAGRARLPLFYRSDRVRAGPGNGLRRWGRPRTGDL